MGAVGMHALIRVRPIAPSPLRGKHASRFVQSALPRRKRRAPPGADGGFGVSPHRHSAAFRELPRTRGGPRVPPVAKDGRCLTAAPRRFALRAATFVAGQSPLPRRKRRAPSGPSGAFLTELEIGAWRRSANDVSSGKTPDDTCNPPRRRRAGYNPAEWRGVPAGTIATGETRGAPPTHANHVTPPNGGVDSRQGWHLSERFFHIAMGRQYVRK